MPVRSFDRLARIYAALERLAFGRSLERARFAHLDALAAARRILVVGDGDGRCLARLLQVAPAASIHAIDTSRAMLHRAAARVPPADRQRVTFERADVRFFQPRGSIDAVVTMFVIDCLTRDEAAAMIGTLAGALKAGGDWLWADFVEPPSGWRRLRARLWLRFLYWFFRVTTNLQVRDVPPAERLFDAAGLVPAAVLELQHGMVRSVRFRKETAG